MTFCQLSKPFCGWRSRLLGLSAVLAILGCDSEPQGIAVSGRATLGGEPLPTGTVFFHPLREGTGVPAEIVDGRFKVGASAGLIAGTYRVEIVSERTTGRQTPNPDAPDQMMEEVRQIVPDRYNVQSELTATVVAGMPELTFELDTK